MPLTEQEAVDLADEIRREVGRQIKRQRTPQVIWGTVSAKVAGSPPTYTFTPEGATAPMANSWPYLGGNAPANGETVGGLMVGSDLFLCWRQTGTS